MDNIDCDLGTTSCGQQNIMAVRRFLEEESERVAKEVEEAEVEEAKEVVEAKEVDEVKVEEPVKKRGKLYLVAVGVEIDSEGLSEILDKELPETKDKRPSKVLSGVYYSEHCSKQHTLQQTYARKGAKEMMEWFQKKRVQCEKDDRAFVKTLHIAKNGRIVAGEVYTGTDKFFVFFYNEKGVPTTLIKKEICQGYTSHYKANYRTVNFDRVELRYRPYYHHQVSGKNVIEFN